MKHLKHTTSINTVLNGPTDCENSPVDGAPMGATGVGAANAKALPMMTFGRNSKVEFEGELFTPRHVPNAEPDAQIVLSRRGKQVAMSLEDFVVNCAGKHIKLIDAARQAMQEADAATGALPSRAIASYSPKIQAEQMLRQFAMRHVDRITLDRGVKPTESIYKEAGILAQQDGLALGISAGKGTPASAKKVRGLYPGWVASNRNPSALIPKHDRKGSKARKKHPRLIKLMRVVIRRFYLTAERPTVAYVYQLLKAMVAKEVECGKLPSATKAPSYETFRNEIDRTIEARVWLAKRYGADAARTLRITKPGIVAERPLQYVFVDHTRFDGFVLVEVRGRYYAVRPWLTVGIDLYTRSVWSAVISLCPPSMRTLAALLRFGVLPKDSAEWGATSPYLVYGIPEVILTDRGQEFLSAFWRMTAAIVGFEWRLCPMASLKGVVERWFGTVASSFCSGLPGRSFASVAERGAYEAGPNAALFMPEVRRDLMQWVIDVDHNRPRKSLGGKTPLEAWQEAMDDPDMQPQTVTDVDAFLIAIGQVETRKITNKGVLVAGAYYSSDDAQRLFAKYGKGFDYQVRFEQTDLPQRIFLLDPDEHRWLTLTCMTPGAVIDPDRTEWLKTVKLEPETWSVHDVAAATQLKIAEERRKIVKAQKDGERPKTGDKVGATKKPLPPAQAATSTVARENARKAVRPTVARGKNAVTFTTMKG